MWPLSFRLASAVRLGWASPALSIHPFRRPAYLPGSKTPSRCPRHPRRSCLLHRNHYWMIQTQNLSFLLQQLRRPQHWPMMPRLWVPCLYLITLEALPVRPILHPTGLALDLLGLPHRSIRRPHLRLPPRPHDLPLGTLPHQAGYLQIALWRDRLGSVSPILTRSNWPW